MSLPVAVCLKRFAAVLQVLIFGINVLLLANAISADLRISAARIDIDIKKVRSILHYDALFSSSLIKNRATFFKQAVSYPFEILLSNDETACIKRFYRVKIDYKQSEQPKNAVRFECAFEYCSSEMDRPVSLQKRRLVMLWARAPQPKPP
jgi:hypothetical protein